MRKTFIAATAVALAGLVPFATPAQDETDKGFLVNFLEESLSDAGRKVEITGFAGALSSRATMERLTIADDQGVWLEIDGAVLDWSRTALLSGAVIINELGADRIALSRIPDSGPGTPSPEAGTFALPELPVSIDIGKVRAERIELGAPVLGEAIVARLDAALHLANGAGEARLQLERIDPGPAELISLDTRYTNETGALSIALDAREGAGGLLSRAIGLPGAPAAELSLNGSGTLDEFRADLRLATDGVTRLSGPVTLNLDHDGIRHFSARVTGDPAPLFLPEYAGFLGSELSLSLAGSREPGGRTVIEALSLGARALSLDGSMTLAADGLPEAFDLVARLAAPDGSPVLLPLTGAPTTVGSADLSLQFNAARSNHWAGRATIRSFARPDLDIGEIDLDGGGTISRASTAGEDGAAAGSSAEGTITLSLSGLGGLDAALLEATGSALGGSLVFRWTSGSGALDLPQIALQGMDYGLEGQMRLKGIDAALNAQGSLTAELRDLSRLSALAGRPLSGAGTLSLAGEVSPLTGAFDLSLSLAGQDLRFGLAPADHLLAGKSEITASLRRDPSGITLRELSATAASLRMEGTGSLASDAIRLRGRIDWADLSDLGAGFGGTLAATTEYEGSADEGTLTLDGSTVALRIGQAAIDRLIAGRSTLSAQVALASGTLLLRHLALDAPALSLAAAQRDGNEAIAVTGRLADLALILPGFPGPVTLDGTIRPSPEGQALDLHMKGPAALDLRLGGHAGARPDLTLALHADAALANGMLDPVTLGGSVAGELSLKGDWGLSALAGRITLAGGRLAIPVRAAALEALALEADIAKGEARLAATGSVSDGGAIRLEGALALGAPFQADLAASLLSVRLRDPGLYETTLDGRLRLAGPLLGPAQLSGRIDLGSTELRIPSTAPGALADIERFRHRGDSMAARATRARAGVEAARERGAATPTGPDWLLDLVIAATNRIFVRGRGLDAELGGAIRLGGSLHRPVPSGSMELVRGRLDILGKRLELDRADLRLEGGFIPWLDVTASNVSNGVTSTIAITGPADDPEVTFSSDPELPQEEVLAHLLFGRGLGKMSAFQAARLASAVATLAGRGGEGIIGRLREGLGLDDLDITTAESGEAEVTAGKYLSENIYSELSTDQTGKSRVDLNLILRPGVTLRARADSTGDSGLGIYLEGDY